MMYSFSLTRFLCHRIFPSKVLTRHPKGSVMKFMDVHWVASHYLWLIAIDVIISIVTMELFLLGFLLDL